MKTSLMYGALLALVGALLTFGLYFGGYHDSTDKLTTAQWIQGGGGLVAAVVCLGLAMRERRTDFPPQREWTYGSALGTGVLTGLVAAFLGAIVTFVYADMVNPGFADLLQQAQVEKFEKLGMSSAQIEAATSRMKSFLSPIAQTCFSFIGGVFWCFLLSLIVAIFFRRREVPVTATETIAAPPTLS